MRATRMAELGWVTVLPEAKPDPQALFDAVEAALASPRRSLPAADLNGLSKLSRIIFDLLQTAGLVENVPISSPTLRKAL